MVLRLGSQAGGIEFGPVDLVCPSAAFVKAPIVATAESMRAQCYVHSNTNDAATCLVNNLRKQIAAHPLELGDAGSGHWLAALVLMRVNSMPDDSMALWGSGSNLLKEAHSKRGVMRGRI